MTAGPVYKSLLAGSETLVTFPSLVNRQAGFHPLDSSHIQLTSKM